MHTKRCPPTPLLGSGHTGVALALRITFDEQADAAYIQVADAIEAGGVARTDLGERSSVNLDFDDDGRLIGVEVLNAGQALSADLLRRLGYRGS